MSLVDDAKQVKRAHAVTNARKKRPDHPKGFEPGIDTEKGTITQAFEHPLEVVDLTDRFNQLLLKWGFPPETFTIEDDRVEVRTWQGLSNIDGPYGGEIVDLWYYKAKVVRRRPVADITDLTARIRKRQPRKLDTKPHGGDRAFALVNTDWQLGKRDGPGTAFTIDAVKNSLPILRNRVESLRRDGHKITDLHIYNLGDLIEGCVGHYPMQTFNVELSRREQVRLGRELLTEQIVYFADDFDRLLVAGVPGNHGENRNDDGKTYTNLGDNDDVALVEQVAEAFDLASTGTSRYDHVSFRIPDNELSMTLDVHGTIVGLTHGHVGNRRPAAGKNLAHSKVWDWWYGQIMGRQPVADADLLLSGHFHYLSLLRQGNRTAIQFPPLDGGSDWFVDSNGLESNASIASLLIGGGVENNQAGWSDLHIIAP